MSRWRCRRTRSRCTGSTATASRVAVFTNLGHDHLDFHGTDELLRGEGPAVRARTYASAAVVNLDDVHGRLLLDVAGGSSVDRSRGYALDDAGGPSCARPDVARSAGIGRDVDVALPGRRST